MPLPLTDACHAAHRRACPGCAGPLRRMNALFSASDLESADPDIRPVGLLARGQLSAGSSQGDDRRAP